MNTVLYFSTTGVAYETRAYSRPTSPILFTIKGCNA